MNDTERMKTTQRMMARSVNAWFGTDYHYDGYGVSPESINLKVDNPDIYVKLTPKKLHGLTFDNLKGLKETDFFGFTVSFIEFIYEDRALYIQIGLKKE